MGQNATRLVVGGSKSLGVDMLTKIQERLKKVIIEHKDFENLIRVYDRPGALFFMDPPYFSAEKYYAERFTHDDHIRLFRALSNIKGKFILTYNDTPFIRELYTAYPICTTERDNNLSSNRGSRYRELIIKNY